MASASAWSSGQGPWGGRLGWTRPPETQTENKLMHHPGTTASGKHAANQGPGLSKEEERQFNNNKDA